MSLEKREKTISQSLGFEHERYLRNDERRLVAVMRNSSGGRFLLKIVRGTRVEDLRRLRREVHWSRAVEWRYPIEVPKIRDTGSDYLIRDFDAGRFAVRTTPPSHRLLRLIDLMLARLANQKTGMPPESDPRRASRLEDTGPDGFFGDLVATFPEPGCSRTAARLLHLRRRGRTIARDFRIPGHGDLKPEVLAVDRHTESVIILDLECFQPRYSPFRDVSRFCCSESIPLEDWTWQRFLPERQLRRVTCKLSPSCKDTDVVSYPRATGAPPRIQTPSPIPGECKSKSKEGQERS
jgi:hypothetical protein